jgi:hypothetical protein
MIKINHKVIFSMAQILQYIIGLATNPNFSFFKVPFERWNESLANHTKEQLAKVSGTSMAI